MNEHHVEFSLNAKEIDELICALSKIKERQIDKYYENNIKIDPISGGKKLIGCNFTIYW